MARQVTSDKNYMKRHPASGYGTMKGPDTAQLFSYYTRLLTIPHNLGYVPMVRVFYEPFRDDVLYEAVHDGQYYLSNPPNTYGGTEDGPTLMIYADETNLYLKMFFSFNTLANVDIPIYWVIYGDYGATDRSES